MLGDGSNPVGSAPGRKRKCVTCTLRFSRLLARFAPRFRSLALLGWIPSALALDQTPDRAVRHAEASPDFAQAPSSREQGPGLVGLRLGQAGLLLWQQFGRSPLEQPQDHPVGDAEGIGDLLRPLAQAEQVERFCTLGRCEACSRKGGLAWTAYTGRCAAWAW